MISNLLPIDKKPNIFNAIFTANLIYQDMQNLSGETNSGCYDFYFTFNHVNLFSMLSGSNYFVDSFSIDYSVDKKYLANILDDNHVPEIDLRKNTNRVFRNRVLVPFGVSNKDVGIWLFTNVDNEAVTMSIKGAIRQHADLIGVESIKAFLSMNVYEVDRKEYSEYVRDYKTGVK